LRAYRAMPWGWLSARGLALSGAWLGVLTYVITPGLVDEAVGDGLAWEMRLRSLPARFTAYFVLGLCLFTSEPYQGVARQVTAGIEALLAAAGWKCPSSTALSAARGRLGEEPLRSLFRRLCSALSPGTAPWSHACGLLAVAWDGTSLAVAGTPENAAAFGQAGSTAGPAGPHLRVVALLACGTRALLDAAIGPLTGKGSGERALAAQLLGSLRPGMLLLADRNFWGCQLWREATATGASLLWRVKEGKHARAIAELPDGSRLARVEDPRAVMDRWHKNNKRARTGNLPPDQSPLPGGITVRVIDYLLAVTADDGTTRTERYRLFTTLLDWRAFPAADLAAAYSRRWAIESGYRECKAWLRGPRALRGRTPVLARQEAWALLAVYQALRTLIARAAARNGTSPDRISFSATLRAARRTMTTPRSQLPAALDATEAEMLSSLIPERPGRIYPRAVTKKTSPYPARRNSKDPISQHATYTTTITPPPAPTRTTPSQPKQTTSTTTQPP
jgi:Insertion element 4 transposase N-terminal/Transposase DDE domain